MRLECPISSRLTLWFHLADAVRQGQARKTGSRHGLCIRPLLIPQSAESWVLLLESLVSPELSKNSSQFLHHSLMLLFVKSCRSGAVPHRSDPFSYGVRTIHSRALTELLDPPLYPPSYSSTLSSKCLFWEAILTPLKIVRFTCKYSNTRILYVDEV